MGSKNSDIFRFWLYVLKNHLKKWFFDQKSTIVIFIFQRFFKILKILPKYCPFDEHARTNRFFKNQSISKVTILRHLTSLVWTHCSKLNNCVQRKLYTLHETVYTFWAILPENGPFSTKNLQKLRKTHWFNVT